MNNAQGLQLREKLKLGVFDWEGTVKPGNKP
jgi:hypothetical protein